jgi:hypothetical protein
MPVHIAAVVVASALSAAISVAAPAFVTAPASAFASVSIAAGAAASEPTRGALESGTPQDAGGNAGRDAGGRTRQDDRQPEGQDRVRRGGRSGMPLPPDWPRAGGFGPSGQDGERPMIEGLVMEGLLPAGFGRRELTDADVAQAIAVAKEVAPEWGAMIEERWSKEPAKLKASLRTGGRRLLGLVALKERAPVVFAAKVAELRAQAETNRVADELARVESEGASPDAVSAAKAALEAAARTQVEATLAARRAELDALEARVRALREDVVSDAARAGELAAEAADRALRRDDAPDRGDRRGDADRRPRE